MKIDEKHPGFSEMQNIKRRFFALRNGVVSDVLRKAGSPYRIIFGLSLVDLRQIAAVTNPDGNVAEALRQNYSTRESRLLWPMIINPSEVSEDQARKWLADVRGVEEADILCNSLLRKLAFSDAVAERQYSSPEATDLQRYASLRMMAAIMYLKPEPARRMADAELSRNCAMTKALAQMIVDETGNTVR